MEPSEADARPALRLRQTMSVAGASWLYPFKVRHIVQAKSTQDLTMLTAEL